VASRSQGPDAARRRVESIQRVEPPTESELRQYYAKRSEDAARLFEEHKNRFELESQLTNAILAPYRELIGRDQRQKSLKAFKERTKLAGIPRKAQPPKLPSKSEPRITAGSIDTIFVPPFTDLEPVKNGSGSVGTISEAIRNISIPSRFSRCSRNSFVSQDAMDR
jgi:hypothetical protein